MLRHIIVFLCGVALLLITIEVLSFWITCENTAAGEVACGVFRIICTQVTR